MPLGEAYKNKLKKFLQSKETVEKQKNESKVHFVSKKTQKEADPKQLIRGKDLEEFKKVGHLKESDKDQKQAKREKLSAKSSKTKASHDLSGSKFRWINEKLYTVPGQESFKLFSQNPEYFQIYHEGFRNQAAQWPINPVDLVADQLRSLPSPVQIADMGCGDAKLAQIFKGNPSISVCSFDLVKHNEFVTACDMAHTGAVDAKFDVVVFCLSLMGTNYYDFLREANRICKSIGALWVVEVSSRIRNADLFVSCVEKMGFKSNGKVKDLDYFSFFTFTKVGKTPKKIPETRILEPCLYKKR
jgi:ribosomal RNA-processing protein 8